MANFVCFVILSLALFASVAVARPGYALDYYVSFEVWYIYSCWKP